MDKEGSAVSPRTARSENGLSQTRESLALLYQGFLTGIVRLQARRQELGQPESFRKRMLIALKDVRSDAVAMGYSPEDVRDAEFAVVAFLDETILGSDDPGKYEWAKQTLSVELLREAHAGEVFFDRLESFRNRQDSLVLADVLEVYLLCLLLGFQGRYVNAPGELQAMVDRTYRRIQGIRPIAPTLIPEALASNSHQGVTRQAAGREPWRRNLVWMVAGCFALFLFLWLHLEFSIESLNAGIGAAR